MDNRSFKIGIDKLSNVEMPASWAEAPFNAAGWMFGWLWCKLGKHAFGKWYEAGVTAKNSYQNVVTSYRWCRRCEVY